MSDTWACGMLIQKEEQCADDESSMKIVAKLLNKAPLKDKEREYFISYPDCLDAA